MPSPERRDARADSKPGLVPPWAVALAVAAFSAGTVITTLVWHSVRPDPFDVWVMRGQEAAFAYGGGIGRVVSITVAPVVIAAMLASAGVAWWVGRWDAVVLALTAAPVALGVEIGLKQLVHRQRPGGPDLVYPSGHLAVASAAFLTIALVLRVTTVPSRTTAIVVSLAGAYVLLIAAARLVETVHFLTDVLGGAATGIVVAVGAALAITVLRHVARASGSQPPPSRQGR